MDETIARLNIELFQRKLAEETDEAKSRTLRQFLPRRRRSSLPSSDDGKPAAK